MTEFLLKLFVKNSSDTEKKEVRSSIGMFGGVIGIICNIFLFIAKLTVGILSGSVSITADALNNISDATSSIVTLLGFRLAKIPADKDHPYGHARYEYLSGLAVAALIIVIGFELVKTSVEKIISPVATAFTFPVFAVLIFSILLKLWLFIFYKTLSKKINSTTLFATAQDSRNDVIATSVVLASSAVEKFWGWQIDGFTGLAVAVFVLVSGISLAKKTISPLLGENASPELIENIVSIIKDCPAVLDFHDLMVHDYGPGQRFASVHVEMDYRTDALLCHEMIDSMERRCHSEFNINLIVHYDPVITDDETLIKMQNEVLKILKDINEKISIHDFRMIDSEERPRLLFDVALPPELLPKKDEIKTELDNKLLSLENKHYETIIIFDMDTQK